MTDDMGWPAHRARRIHYRSVPLAQELLLLERQLRELARPESATPPIQTTSDAKCAIDALLSTVAGIRGRVVGVDGLGETLDSLAELALRASRLIILDTLDDMRVLRACRAWMEGCGVLFPVADITAFFRRLFARITEIWMRFRRGQPAESRALYRSATRVARRAMLGLARDPDVVGILREGEKHPSLRRGCWAIDVALTVTIDADLDSTLLVTPQLFHFGAEIVWARRPSSVDGRDAERGTDLCA